MISLRLNLRYGTVVQQRGSFISQYAVSLFVMANEVLWARGGCKGNELLLILLLL